MSLIRFKWYSYLHLWTNATLLDIYTDQIGLAYGTILAIRDTGLPAPARVIG
jgi:hypothetical protein